MPKKRCNACGALVHNLNHHKCNSHPDKLYKCNQCIWQFLTSSNLKRHVNSVHLKTRLFKCSRCNFYSPRKDTVLRHIRLLHRIRCKICCISFQNQKLLREHLHTDLQYLDMIPTEQLFFADKKCPL